MPNTLFALSQLFLLGCRGCAFVRIYIVIELNGGLQYSSQPVKSYSPAFSSHTNDCIPSVFESIYPSAHTTLVTLVAWFQLRRGGFAGTGERTGSGVRAR